MALIFTACRVCGCTEARACVTEDGPCWWVEGDLCSACAAREGRALGPGVIAAVVAALALAALAVAWVAGAVRAGGV